MGLDRMGIDKISGRPLEFIFILDVSGSMRGEKINTLNTAIRDLIPEMQEVAKSNPNVQIMVRALTFGSGANWHIKTRTPIEQLKWRDVKVGGNTDIGSALDVLKVVLDDKVMPRRGLPPVLVLISDGRPTDSWKKRLKEFKTLPWVDKAVRVAIGVKGADIKMLEQFISHMEMGVLEAKNAEQLTGFIKFASTQVLQATSASSSKIASEGNSNGMMRGVDLPAYPEYLKVTNTEDFVW